MGFFYIISDTEPVYEKIVSDILKTFNKPYPLETRLRVLGTNEFKTCEIAVNELKLPITADEFFIKFRKLCDERLGNSDLLGGKGRNSQNLGFCDFFNVLISFITIDILIFNFFEGICLIQIFDYYNFLHIISQK